MRACNMPECELGQNLGQDECKMNMIGDEGCDKRNRLERNIFFDTAFENAPGHHLNSHYTGLLQFVTKTCISMPGGLYRAPLP